MAKATTTIHRLQVSEEEQRLRDVEEIEKLLIEHKETLKDLLQMIGKMNERGVLEMVSSLFSEGDRVLDVLVKAVDKPEAASILKNGLLMLGTLGKLNVAELGPVVEKLNGGIAEAAKNSREEASYSSILRTAASPEIKQAAQFLFSFLKGLGEGGIRSKQVVKVKKESSMDAPKSWMVAAAGASLLGLALMAKKK